MPLFALDSLGQELVAFDSVGLWRRLNDFGVSISL